MIGTVASIMSSTIINVAVPDMSRYFVLGQDRLQWVSSGFMVAMTISMLTTPWLLSRFGYRKTYSGAIWLLFVGGVRADCPAILIWYWWHGWPRVWPLVSCNRSPPSSSCVHSRPTRKGVPVASLGWVWCWPRPLAPALVGCWSTGLAGVPPSSWWCRFVSLPCTWPDDSFR